MQPSAWGTALSSLVHNTFPPKSSRSFKLCLATRLETISMPRGRTKKSSQPQTRKNKKVQFAEDENTTPVNVAPPTTTTQSKKRSASPPLSTIPSQNSVNQVTSSETDAMPSSPKKQKTKNITTSNRSMKMMEVCPS